MHTTDSNTVRMKVFPLFRLIGILVLVFVNVVSSASAGNFTINLSANPNILLADGRSKTTITATLSDISGATVADGTLVHFTVTSGTISPDVVASSGGVARAFLTSSPIAGNATVSASFIGPNGGANSQLKVEYTTDSSLANTDDIASNWIRVYSRDYLAYSADTKTLDTAGKSKGVHLTYRGLMIDADAMQVDFSSNVVRARHATVTRNHLPPANVDALLYYLDAKQGTAIVSDAPGLHRIQEMNLDGSTLQLTEIPARPDSAMPTDYQFMDLSRGHVLITASSVSVQPGSQIQLARATIYVDSKKLVSMPNQIMPLSTTQILGQQVIGYGTDGVFMDIPYYSYVSPTGTGAFNLRTRAAALQSGTSYTGRDNIALDYDRTFVRNSGSSDLKVIGLNSSSFGLRWIQNQTLPEGTKSYLYIDSPLHQSIYSTLSLRHTYHYFSADVELTKNDNLGHTQLGFGDGESVSVEDNTNRLFGSPKTAVLHSEFVSVDRTVLGSYYSQQLTKSVTSSKSYGTRLRTPQISLGKNSTLTDSLTIENQYQDQTHFGATNLIGNLGLQSQLFRSVSSSLQYTYTHQPVFTPKNFIGLNGQIYNQTDKSDITYSLATSDPRDRWSTSFSTTYGMPSNNASYSTSFTYHVTKGLRFEADNFSSKFSGYSYNENTFSLSQQIGGRDVIISWSDLLHRFQFNLAQAQF